MKLSLSNLHFSKHFPPGDVDVGGDVVMDVARMNVLDICTYLSKNRLKLAVIEIRHVDTYQESFSQ